MTINFIAIHPVTLMDTAYCGEVSDISPQDSFGDADIVITGRAVERITGDALANVPLDLVITLKSFERKYVVFTGEDGIFTHSFTPLANEAGVYNVRAVHPDLTDKPIQGQFIITRVTVTPAALNLSTPKNYEKTGVALNETAVETVVLENRGLAEMHDVQVSLKDQSGSPAPAWVFLNSSADPGDMPVGDARQVAIAFSPTDGGIKFKVHHINTCKFVCLISMQWKPFSFPSAARRNSMILRLLN